MGGFAYKLRRTTLWLFIIVMPIGIRIDPEHPDELTVSAHGGVGQVVSVIRDCSGNPIASEKNKFVDMAGSVQVSHCSESGVIFALGVRGGNLDSNARMPLSSYVDGAQISDSYEQSVSYSYYNPYAAMESKYIGIGAGYLSSEIPFTFGDSSDNLPMSSHLRIGNYHKANFQTSLNEDLPLASGGGYFKIGMGYPVGSKARLFSGLSAGFYDGLGFVQQVFLPLSNRFDLDLSVRLGSTESLFEGGFAMGLRYHLPFGTREKSTEGNFDQ
ncbi:MAG: hypothetical protein ABFS42_11765 [Candidatus Krumholzibacteriota bacterium]